MANVLNTISSLTLEAQVLDRLREAILEGHFLPGSQLNQVQVASQFGVSRGPVRAAINKLEEEGLVRNIPHKGTYVTPLDRKDVGDIYSVRAILEAYGTRLAVERCEPENIFDLSQIIEEMRKAARLGDTAEVIRLDLQVHEFFLELSGNSFLMKTWSTIKVQVRRVLAFRHHAYPNLVEIADSHLPFIELCEAHDAETAGRLMEAHIEDACHDLMERWNTTDFQKEPSL